MAVIIRLARHGRRNRPYYRIVVTDHENKRDGRYLELLGTYNTLTKPSAITLKQDRVKYWLSVGAKASTTLQSIFEREMPGLYKSMVEKRRTKIKTTRAKRKARIKARGGKKTTAAATKKAAKKAKAKAPKKVLKKKEATA